MIGYTTTFGVPVRATVITRDDEYPASDAGDVFALHEARCDLESLRFSDVTHHARAMVILRAGVALKHARHEAGRIRAAIAFAAPTDDEPRAAQVPACGRCGRSFDCSCFT